MTLLINSPSGLHCFALGIVLSDFFLYFLNLFLKNSFLLTEQLSRNQSSRSPPRRAHHLLGPMVSTGEVHLQQW